MTAIEEGAPATSQANISVPETKGAAVGDAHLGFDLPDELQAVTQVFGTLETKAGGAAGDIPLAVTIVRGAACSDSSVVGVIVDIIDGSVQLAVNGHFGIGSLSGHGQGGRHCQGEKLLLHGE